MGHLIQEGRVFADPKKIESIQKWPCPSSINELRAFLGLTGFYRRFIKDYDLITRPLHDLLKKHAFEWNDAATSAFETLKGVMCGALVLELLDFSKTFVVETDASGRGVGTTNILPQSSLQTYEVGAIYL